jgi:sugar lactone lactonase YvrE
VTSTSATLEASINPQGQKVGYRFEYGTAACASNPCLKTPEAVLTAKSSPVAVTAQVKGLSPGTTYHFRAVAENGSKEHTDGPDGTFMTYQPAQVFPACPNDGLRKENPAAARIEYSSAALPDCRAYEQASPVNKDAGDVTGTVAFVKASLSGGAISFLSASGVPGGHGSQELPAYLASRAGGWSTQGMLPPAAFGQAANVVGWTPDFSDVYSEATRLGEPQETTFLDTPGGGEPIEIVGYTPNLRPRYAGSTADGSQVLFESKVAIPSVAGAIEGKSNVYLWDKASEKLSLVDVLNEGGPPPTGAFAGSYDWLLGTNQDTLAVGGADRRYYTQAQHAISDDGSAVYFTAAGTGQLYVRLNPSEAQSDLDEGKCIEPALACTIRVSSSKRTIPDPAGTRPAAFMGASADGSKSFFTSTEMLTEDADTGPEQTPATIERSDLEGENIEPSLVTTHGSGVAVDAEHVYWVNLDLGTIARAKLDGSDPESEFITAAADPKGVAVANGYVYWTNAAIKEKEEDGTTKVTEGTIGRAKLGAVEAEEVDQGFIEAAGNPHAVTADTEHVFWTNDPTAEVASPGFIGRAGVGGGGVNPKLVETITSPNELPGIAVDAEHIYWMDTNDGDFSRVSRANLDGSGYFEPGVNNITFIFLGQHVAGKGVAVDGTHIYWSTQASETIGRAKLNGEEAASEEEPELIEDANHPQGVAVDGAGIYWTSNGESSPNPGNDLYRYDAGTEALSDLAPDSTSPNGAEVRGVLGTSEDGSYVYFAANGVPDGVSGSPNGRGEEAEAGDCPSEFGDTVRGICNLYLAHDNTIQFIARLEVGGVVGGVVETDAANWAATPTGVFPNGNFQKTSRVTPDGQTLLFRSQRRLTDYQNDGAAELYLYRAGESEVSCVSCNPTGAAPNGGEWFFGAISPSTIIPARPSSFLGHNLSTDGKRVFFETTDALVGADTNGELKCPPVGSTLQQFPACLDVYEWEAQGTGTCDAAHAVADGGCVYLISTGKGSEPALIADASGDGKDVFFFTRSRLVGQDEDTLVDVYDARVEGGLAAQNPPPRQICEGEASCRPEAIPQAEIAAPPKPSSPGNPKAKKAPCAKGKHKVKGRCVANKGKAKKHNKKQGHKKAHAKRRAGR